MIQENQNPSQEIFSNNVGMENTNYVAPTAPTIDLESLLEKTRNEWSIKVVELANMQKDFMNFGNTQIELFTSRQIATDQIHNLVKTFTKLGEKYKKQREQSRSKAPEFKDVKSMNEYVDAVTASTKTSLDLITNQIEYFRETVKNIDSMIYGIKHRLDFETNYRRA